MRFRARAFRIVRVSVVAVLALILFAFTFVQGQQYLLRYRAGRLLADFQSLKLKQSTWADAQRLMVRWGDFGHYDGTCSAETCSYFITLEDKGWEFNRILSESMERHWPQSYSGITFGRIYRVLGGRMARMRVGFLIEDGIVQRSSVGMLVDGPQDNFWCDWNCGDLLMVSARAYQSLNAYTGGGPWAAGDNEQLAQHPNYKAGRPSGCEGCMAGIVTFTPFASQDEIRSLTTYNLACFTSHFHPCRTLPDLLPMAREWRLYPTAEGVPEQTEPSGPPIPCDIPVFALGRDAKNVLQVKVLSVQTGKEPPDSLYPAGRDVETASVQVTSVLKGPTAWPLDAAIKATPFNWDINFPRMAGEHFEAGKTLLVIPDSQHSNATLLSMSRCGVLSDSPKVHNELAKGFAQNDQLRHKEDFGSILW